MKLVYNVNDKPKFGQTLVFALQQLLAIMAATIAVPMIIGHGMSTAAALLGAGVGTLVYLLFTKFRSPVFLGSSFAFLGSMGAAFAGAATMELGYLGLVIGAFIAGLVYVVIALLVKLVGVNWVNKLMPAVVIGPTVAIIGLSLAGNAVGDLQKSNYSVEVSGYTYVEKDDSFIDDNGQVADRKVFYAVDKDGKVDAQVTYDAESNTFRANRGSSYVAVICGIITLAATMLASCYGKKMMKLIPFIIGILSGYAAASVFYLIGVLTGNQSLMVISYAPITALFENGVQLSTFLQVPDFTFVKALGGFKNFDISYLVTVAVAYAPVAFVVFAEHIADHKNLSTVIEKDLLEDPGLHRTLLGDGVGSMAGAFFGGCPNTTYGESVGCVAISGNASVVTILTTAVMAILIAFVSPFVAFLSSIPSCVMGGVCIALYGFIAVSGLKMIQKVDLEQNHNLFVVSAILIAGIGGLTLTFGKVTVTSIACALILGILANVMLKKSEKAAPSEQ